VDTNISGQRPLAHFMIVHFTAELTVKFINFYRNRRFTAVNPGVTRVQFTPSYPIYSRCISGQILSVCLHIWIFQMVYYLCTPNNFTCRIILQLCQHFYV